MTQPPANLSQLLQRLRDQTEGQDQVSIGDLLAAVGQRSFGPIVLVAGLIVVAPLIGDIPGVPTLLGLVVLLTLGQLLFRRETIWLPHKLTHRRVGRDKLMKGLDWMAKPARFVDRWSRPRLTWLVRGPGRYLMAIICMLVAAAMPAMEVVPFSANGGGLALMVFGMAMVARDGLLALLGMVLTGGTLWFVLAGLMGS
ncbi:exopolysaccharide biosynthesis protein [Marinobacter qingdaonensis]|uniref:Exopolysaccharide biosynthesis protein n=1 Tax=Marinobacter qingdaonensis TaxID=3108486 RepID=A0ABU5NY83_9GAMM|nr:exopolysaccharide biosynthesis protein [Marinobacter sp. ASW11-75]MEA1080755.1 exopolysaccharide biosynthesis protein [Marinobacter sp. ASW11-75]